ncbi:transcription termination factor NusA [bacterium]|nr:transcription termination factor NusA [bacterium]
MITEFSAALNQVATERGISPDSVLQALNSALVAAYNRDFEEDANEDDVLVAHIDPITGEAKILKNGKDVTPPGFGRIATQTAKQVIIQQIRKTETDNILEEYRDKLGTIVYGVIFRIDSNLVVLDLGRIHGVMPLREQVETENYRMGQRLNVLVKDIQDGPRGTEIIVSRSDKDFVKALFLSEVPEMQSGVVTVRALAREAGSRTKIAVISSESSIDPVGACVGHKGVRVQSVLEELNGEKVDIVPFSADIEKFIANSLSPATVTGIKLNEETKTAVVRVPEDQQSLAIGKQGQNVRLAHKLTEWKIDIEGVEDLAKATAEIDKNSENEEKDQKVRKKRTTPIAVLGLDKKVEKALRNVDVSTVEKLKEVDRKSLLEIEGIGPRTAEKILKILSVH